ncbi:hypothetical protein [Oricola sp.]|uniref:hypothetical protein n=1 Tax=Oricola sp. TaxID=1979950 RepID=UPI003BA875DA
MKVRTQLFNTAAAAAMILALTGHASADIDAEAVFEGLKRQFAKQGVDVAAGSVASQGANDVIISDITLSAPDEDGSFMFGGVVLQQVVEAGDGGFLVGRMSAPAGSMTQEGVTVTFDGANLEGYYIPGPNDPDPVAAAGIFRRMNIGAMTVSTGGNTIFEVDGVTSEISPYEPGGTLDYDFEVTRFEVDFANLPDPQARATMSEFGYDQLTGRISGDGSWNTASGDMSANMAYEFDDAANLNIDLSIGGYTTEVLAAMQALQEQLAQQPNNDAAGMAMLGLMQQLEISGLSIEVVDRSLTGRALDFAARQQGTNRESIVAQAKGVLPFALAQLQNPEFAAKVSAAVSTYLDNPRSLRIVSAPASPVPVAQIMGAAMGAPQTLISVLAVDISANGE